MKCVKEPDWVGQRVVLSRVARDRLRRLGEWDGGEDQDDAMWVFIAVMDGNTLKWERER